MLPFTRDQFFEVFAAYNAVTWPAVIVAYLLALIVLVLVWRGTPQAGRVVAAVLALMWGWVGIVYQALFFIPVNPMARVFALAFMIQALLFSYHVWKRRGLEYGARSRLRTGAGATMIVYAMIFYPLIGFLAGERYTAIPLFGVAPCPLVIYTFGLLLWASRVKWWLWVVPAMWALVGGSAAILLSVPQDRALPLSAIVALLILWKDRRQTDCRPQ
ncbi:DUF6064 family protein [Aurantiacibacter gilvus]|uniref:DUF6064 family protein n=1 Tax=Aurantiacibacter gilvus TaxID=3139141 RepID=A0ABU9IFH6_9SPHN